MATTDLATPGGTLDAQTLIGSSNPQTPQFSHIQLCAVFLSKPDCFFIIKVAPDDNVYECQRMVKGENENHCVNVDAGDILLWKLKEPIPCQDANHSLQSRLSDLSASCEKLNSGGLVGDYFRNPPRRHTHMIVELPSLPKTPQNQFRSPRIPYSLPKTDWDEEWDVFKEMLARDIKQYLEQNTQLPCYEPQAGSNSIRQHISSLRIPVISAKNEPSLLLHNLGHNSHDPHLQRRIETVFGTGTSSRFLCNTSGSGKTRLLFEGLSRKWGLYFTATTKPDGVGSRDLETILDDFQYESRLQQIVDEDKQQKHLNNNRDMARRRFLLILFARLSIFHVFLECASSMPGGIVPAYKERWLLLQIAPKKILRREDDCFVSAAQIFGGASWDFLTSHAPLRLSKVKALIGSDERVFCVLDEAQVTSDEFLDYFGSVSSPSTPRPILQEILSAWRQVLDSLVISGTGISRQRMKTVSSASVAKISSEAETVTDVGAFDNDEDQQNYLNQYLPRGYLDTPAGTHLASRIIYWLHGRHRFTATYITCLIMTGFEYPHWVLNEFVYRTSAFRPSDHDEEAPLSPVQLPGSERFNFKNLTNDPALLRQIVGFVFDYIFKGKQRILGNTEYDQLVEYGFARFRGDNHLVADEPLALLAAIHYFNKETTWTLGYFLRDGLTTSNENARGIAFEQLGAYLLANAFRSPTPLSQVFQFHGPTQLGDQVAQLVAIHQEDGSFVCNPIDILSNTVPTYILGRSHSTAQQTISWLEDPCRSVFCFPANSVGPNLILVLRLSDGQVLRVVVQFKHITGNTIGAADTREAICTTDPEHFIAQPAVTETLKKLGPGTEKAGELGVLRVLVAFPAVPNLATLAAIAEADAKRHPIATVDIVSLATDNDLGRAVLKSLAPKVASEARQRKRA